MWYQVVNHGGIKPNYLESSGSAIFAYAIMKSVRLGYLDDSYFSFGEKAFEGICRTYLSEKDGELQLDEFALWQVLEIKICVKEPLITICGNPL